MASASTTDKSLSELFKSAKARQESLDELDPRSERFKETAQGAINDLEECLKLIEQGSLFSANEEAEDISTNELQYLNVPYLLAELRLRSYNDQRAATLQRACQLLEDFLTRLEHYGMLRKNEQELFERFQQERSNFSITSTVGPEEKRRIKITRFQEEKALKQKLQHLRSQSGSERVDDEVIRSLYLAEIALHVHQSFQSLDMISQELSILAQIQHEPVVARPVQDDRTQQRSDGYSERLDGPGTMGGLGRRGGPLLDGKGKPLQPFTILGKRSQLQKGVFRPGHNLPTMSIDEYLEEERRRGGIIEGGGNANAPPVELDEDNMELVDEATMKAREWDEFVEANPKGAGNTLNRG
ncbi:hypothetical protein DV738_g3430, partial [Chaetothyriales sp. CBS 135597]